LRLRAAAETRRRACGGGRRCTCDPLGAAAPASIPLPAPAATGHGAVDAAAAFRRTFATRQPRFAAPRPSFQRPTTCHGLCHRLAPDSRASPNRGAKRAARVSARSPRQERFVQHAQARDSGSRSASKSRSNASCSRSRGSAIRCRARGERQIRIDRLQRRVQQWQAQKPQNRRRNARNRLNKAYSARSN